MSQCMCLNPVIIKNHVDRYKINCREWFFYLRGREVYHVPSPKRARIQVNDLDSCYYLNKVSGEMVPMYIQVPCNKCIICGEKKARDWSARIVAESQFHDNHPWWITLTYNSLSLPEDGSISKKELSNFLKRLRERVSRVVGSDVRLRFVGTGEYGFNHARPHYHLELFGMPVMCVTKVLMIVENAWSTRITKERYLKLHPKCRFIRMNKNGDKMYYQRKGFVYVKPAHDNTPLYLAKYMFKPELNTPFGCTPNFNLASRKNGIGYEYAISTRDWRRHNPSETRMTIVNKFSGEKLDFGIPSYFKDIWFPTISKALPNDVKKSIDEYRDYLGKFNFIKWKLDGIGIAHEDDVDILSRDISNKYTFLPELTNYMDSSFDGDMKFLYNTYYRDIIDEFSVFGSVENFFKDIYLQYYKHLLYLHEYIMSLEFDTQVFEDTINLREIHKSYVSLYMSRQPQIDMKEYAWILRKRWEARKRKDKN